MSVASSSEEFGLLCMLACIHGNGGEVFFPKLGDDQMLTFSAIGDDFVKAEGSATSYSAAAPRHAPIGWYIGGATAFSSILPLAANITRPRTPTSFGRQRA